MQSEKIETRETDRTLGISRRAMVGAAAGGILGGALGGARAFAAEGESKPAPLKGNIRHAVCKWCYGSLSLEQLAVECKRIGIEGMDLVGPEDWPTLKKYGLKCTMTPSHGIVSGLNRTENHAECLEKIRAGIEASAEAGFPNVIAFSGNRAGMPDDVGLENCAAGLKQVVGLAEQRGVTICMELLNSKQGGHVDYMCDHTAWGVELCKRVGSDRLKLLYDVYHIQIMEGDIIKTIGDSIAYIGHFHTGGVPGRNEIDESQELYYPAIMRAIVQTGFKGCVAQEFIPKRNPVESLEQAIRICDV